MTTDINEFGEHIDAEIAKAVADAEANRVKLTIAARAAEALDRMLQPEDPMPAAVAIDFVQEVTDDREVAYGEIRGAIDVWLRLRRPEDMGLSLGQASWLAGKIAGQIETGAHELAEFDLVEFSKAVHAAVVLARAAGLRSLAEKWCEWCKDAYRAITLGHHLVAALYPPDEQWRWLTGPNKEQRP